MYHLNQSMGWVDADKEEAQKRGVPPPKSQGKGWRPNVSFLWSPGLEKPSHGAGSLSIHSLPFLSCGGPLPRLGLLLFAARAWGSCSSALGDHGTFLTLMDQV